MIGLNSVLTGQALPGFLQAYLNRTADIGFNFLVLFDFLPWGDFFGIEGISREVEAYSYKELGQNLNVHELRGQGTFPHVTLKWGLMNRDSMFNWIDEINPSGDASLSLAAFGSTGFRKDVTVIQMTRGKIPLRIYVFSGAWPVRWQGADLSGMDSVVQVESLELAFQRLKLLVLPLPF